MYGGKSCGFLTPQLIIAEPLGIIYKMTLLPIQFWTKFNQSDFRGLDTPEVLDLVQKYLEEKGFNYISRKENKLIFHKADGWTSFNTKSFLVSGVVKVRKDGQTLRVINGNWMVLIIALPFITFLMLSESNFSTLDESDLTIIWNAFLWIFIGNLIIRIIAHLSFKGKIEELIRKNYAQQNL